MLPLHWHTEPLLILTVVGASWLHAMACGPLRGRLAPGSAYPVGHAVRFHLGVLAAYLAVGSPLDQLGEAYLFSAHMLQHMLLIYGAAPLVAAGLPPEMIDRWLERSPRALGIARLLVHPLFAAILFTLVFSCWHFPELYEWALRDRLVHVIEHWTIFLPAVLLVWPLVSTSRVLPRLGHGASILYAVALMVADLPLWAALIFGDQPIYDTYRLAPRITGLDPLQDQILGASAMKVFNEAFSLWHMGAAFLLWYRAER
ncbi:MAG: cytochrome c oxidase assembly protein [Opitutia bacterium]